MNIAVVGSRSIIDYDWFKTELEKNLPEDKSTIETFVSGGAKGIDSLIEQYSKETGIPIKIFLPNWNLYGKPAGLIRNKLIIDFSDKVIAFHDGISTGTLHSISLAKAANKEVIVITKC